MLRAGKGPPELGDAPRRPTDRLRTGRQPRPPSKRALSVFDLRPLSFLLLRVIEAAVLSWVRTFFSTRAGKVFDLLLTFRFVARDSSRNAHLLARDGAFDASFQSHAGQVFAPGWFREG